MVDLNSVTYIDETGEEELLAEMHAAGVEFLASGIQNKHPCLDPWTWYSQTRARGPVVPDGAPTVEQIAEACGVGREAIHEVAATASRGASSCCARLTPA